MQIMKVFQGNIHFMNYTLSLLYIYIFKIEFLFVKFVDRKIFQKKLKMNLRNDGWEKMKKKEWENEEREEDE